MVIHFFNAKKGGKGAALRRGPDQGHGQIVVIQDADSDDDPQELNKPIGPIHSGETDVVYGSRQNMARAAE